MSYTNAKSVRDAIFDALIFNLQKIDGGGSPYYNPIVSASIFEDNPQVDGILSWPAVCIYTGKEVAKYAAAGNDTYKKTLTIGLHFYTSQLPTGKTARQWRSSILEDLEYLIGANPHLPDSGGNPTCFLAIVGDNAPDPAIIGQTYTGIGVEVIIDYYQSALDPSVRAG